MECPNCRKINAATALYCDCGYEFKTGKITSTHVNKGSENLASSGLKHNFQISLIMGAVYFLLGYLTLTPFYGFDDSKLFFDMLFIPGGILPMPFSLLLGLFIFILINCITLHFIKNKAGAFLLGISAHHIIVFICFYIAIRSAGGF